MQLNYQGYDLKGKKQYFELKNLTQLNGKLYKFRGVKILNECVCLDEKDKIINVTEWSRKIYTPSENIKDYKEVKFKENLFILDNTVSIIGYYHFWVDIMSMYFSYKNNNLINDKSIFIVNERSKECKYFKETLEYLNIKNIFYVNEKKFLTTTENIYFYSIVSTDQSKIIPPLSGLEMNKLSIPKDINLRIYISRKNSQTRHIVNEEIIFDFLKSNNFLILYLERLSIKEQINYFSNASIVLAPHGAGLINLCFMQKNTKVIELSSKDLWYYDNCFMIWCNYLGINHTFVEVESMNNEKSQHLSNFEINNKDVFLETIKNLIN